MVLPFFKIFNVWKPAIMIMIIVIVINYVLLSRFNIWMGNGPGVPGKSGWQSVLHLCLPPLQ